MRFSTALVVLAGLVASSSAARLFARQYPACANDCLTNAKTGSCDPSDLGCLCKNQDFINSTTQCIEGACTGQDLKDAEQTAVSLCETVGVTLSGTPTAGPSATGSGAASASGSAAASASGSGSPSGSSASAKASNTAPASSGASGSVSTSPAPSATGNGATAHGSNALLGLAAVGLAAFAL